MRLPHHCTGDAKPPGRHRTAERPLNLKLPVVVIAITPTETIDTTAEPNNVDREVSSKW